MPITLLHAPPNTVSTSPFSICQYKGLLLGVWQAPYPQQNQSSLKSFTKLNTSGNLQNKVRAQPWLLGLPLPAPLLLRLLARTQGLLLVINCTVPKRITGSEVSQQVVPLHRDEQLQPALSVGLSNWPSLTSFWEKAKTTGPELSRHHKYWTSLQLLQLIQNRPEYSPKQYGAWMVQVEPGQVTGSCHSRYKALAVCTTLAGP